MDNIESMDIDCPELKNAFTSESLNPEIKTVVNNPTPEMVNVMVKNAIIPKETQRRYIGRCL